MCVCDYITEKDLRNPITWGSDVEIMALCTMIQCTVHVWCDLTGGAAWAHVIGGTRHWVHMEPLFYNSTCVRCHTITLIITCISIITGVETTMTELL